MVEFEQLWDPRVRILRKKTRLCGIAVRNTRNSDSTQSLPKGAAVWNLMSKSSRPVGRAAGLFAFSGRLIAWWRDRDGSSGSLFGF